MSDHCVVVESCSGRILDGCENVPLKLSLRSLKLCSLEEDLRKVELFEVRKVVKQKRNARKEKKIKRNETE